MQADPDPGMRVASTRGAMPPARRAAARQALVFGASGQIGRALLVRLHDAGWQVTAVSRVARADEPTVEWRQGGFDAMPALPPAFDAIFSCGPLDRFAGWYAAAAVDAPHVVAFGSTSVLVKGDSADAHERDLARRLAAGEAGVFATARAKGAAATVLRPTLVYGAGTDRTLSRIAAIARRTRVFPLPADAVGLRQPVHVDDLAIAALAACGSRACDGNAYAVPGGETLPYRDMVARVLAVLDRPARVATLPPALFRALLAAAQALGVARGLGATAVARMRDDLVFDTAPARRDFDYRPRPFRPTAAMFDERPG
ncbi:NAD-dependent epimerase/dehydratase family protein [Luteimonas pelagia]